MADRSIGQLTEATSIGATDLLIMEQAGTAKKVQGRTLLEWVDGHGGLSGVSFGDDYTVTFLATDGTTWTSPSLRGATGETGPRGYRGVHGTGVTVKVTNMGSSFTYPNGAYQLTITETVYNADDSTTEREKTVIVANGETGPKGDTGDKGDKGDPGNSYVVKGLYVTLSALQAAHPTGSEGDAWFVGTSDSNVVYQWDVDKSAWVNAGPLKGPKGDTGTTGAQGEPGTDGKSAYEAAQDGGYTGTETAFNAALAHVENKADKSVSAAATLTAAGWSDGVQTLAVSGVTASSNGSLRIAQSATDEQFAAWGAAQPRVTAQAAGSLTVKAAGTVPTIDIPVEVIVL